MHVELKKRPKSPIIIEGFPGFGLVSTIATEFLIEHLDAKPIGRIWSDKLMPLVAIHQSKLIPPLEIYYDEKENILIIHALSNITGLEWNLSRAIIKLSKELKAKEVISLEGVGALQNDGNKIFFYTNVKNNANSFEKIGLMPLKEGIVVGVTGALMVERENLPLSCIFAETTSGLPDSRAAAKIIEVLDKYLDLDVDYAPLLQSAEKFERKVKGLYEKSKDAMNLKERKELSYLG